MQDNLSEKEIEEMIRDLKCFPEFYATDHTEWDESSKISGELHNHLFDRKISDLTIYEFTKLVRDIVRMELREQLTNINFTQIQPLPYPQRQPYPWEGPWANSEGYVTCNSLKQPHLMPEDVTITSTNLEGDINVR